MTQLDIDDFDILPPPTPAFDEGMTKIFKDVMQLPLNNHIPLAIHHAGVSTWHQFMYMDEEDFCEKSTYVASDGKVRRLSKYEDKLLKWLIGYVRQNIDNHKNGSDKPEFYTKDGFTAYTQERRKINRFRFRYRRTSDIGETDDGDQKKSLEDHIVDVCTKLKKTASDILEKHKEQHRAKKEHYVYERLS